MIDLHTHSNFSDGTDTPTELLNKALASGLTTIALTDHDTMAGWDEAITHVRHGLSLVLGSEISCQTSDGISVHMLGLLFDPTYQPLTEMMALTRENRITRMAKILVRLNAANYHVTMEEVEAQLSAGATLGRPHLADALIAKGYMKSREEVFAEILHNDSPFYVSHYSPTPEAAIAFIKEAGGVAVIAHPMSSLRSRVVSPVTFESYVDAGLDGIEVFHRDHTYENRVLLSGIADQFELAKTGSSDYHGNGKLNQLGECVTDPMEFEK
ncbi:MAG TPA: PHP domain-containing protein, partial [Candidatus Nanopelagicaceae bacterium]